MLRLPLWRVPFRGDVRGSGFQAVASIASPPRRIETNAKSGTRSIRACRERTSFPVSSHSQGIHLSDGVCEADSEPPRRTPWAESERIVQHRCNKATQNSKQAGPPYDTRFDLAPSSSTRPVRQRYLMSYAEILSITRVGISTLFPTVDIQAPYLRSPEGKNAGGIEQNSMGKEENGEITLGAFTPRRHSNPVYSACTHTIYSINCPPFTSIDSPTT
jgi:hypothetical protein